jgi:uncharacterized membrane protein
MTRFLLRLIAVALASGVAGCNYNNVLQSAPEGYVSIEELNLEQLDYAAVQKSVIGPRCLSCHSNQVGNQGGVNLESYKAMRALLNRVAYRALERQDMPPREPMSEREKRVLRSWIENGAPESITGPVAKPDPQIDQGPTDWAKIQTKIFGPRKCLDCHSGKEPQAGLDLSDILQVRAKAGAIFERVIVKQDMPLPPLPSVSPRERRVLLQWFDLGMPE